MREILFRGKLIDDFEWVTGSLIQYGKDALIFTRFGTGMYHTDPETVGQYTGMTDKNGAKIFEGDIVHFEYQGTNKGLHGSGKVVCEDCKFALEWGWHKEIVCLTNFHGGTFEVIGNIYDNPELMEG